MKTLKFFHFPTYIGSATGAYADYGFVLQRTSEKLAGSGGCIMVEYIAELGHYAICASLESRLLPLMQEQKQQKRRFKMNTSKNVVGIDISYLTFNAHCNGIDYSYSNDSEGWQKLCDDTHGETFAMEATGNYYYKLAFYLHSKGFNVLVFNPYRVGCYIKSLGVVIKTDKHDAKMILHYSMQEEAHRYKWKPLPKKLERAKSIVSLLSSLSGIVSASKNVQHAAKLVIKKDDSLLDVMPKISCVLKEQQENLKKELSEIISDVYPDKFQILQSIPGIASYSAAVLLVHGRGLECFASSRKFAKFIGITPKINQSGTSVRGSNSISKCGNPYVRSLLYMCSKSASLYCKPCVELKNRLLAKGKPNRVIRVAIMHRLVKIVFGVIQSGASYRGGKMAA